MEGLRLPKAELRRRFGLSERLAVRVGALRAKGLLVTAAVLEEVRRDRALEKLLLSREILARAGRLDTAELRKLSPAAAALAVSDGVLGFEERALAVRPALLDRGEAERLFAPEDVSRLKLALLTEVDPRRKILALRQAALAPLSSDEKGALALHALVEPEPEVRREAAALLKSLGLDPSLAETLSMLSDGAASARMLAAQKLASFRARPPERAVALAGLVAALRHESGPETVAALVDALVPFADLLTGEPLAAAGRELVKRLAEHRDAVAPAVQRLLAALGRSRRAGTAEALWREVEGVTNREIRSLFATALASMEHGADFRRAFAKAVAADLAAAPVEDLSVRRLVEASKGMGEEFLEALLGAFPTVPADAKGSFLAVVDSVATTDFVGSRARDAAGRLFLDVLRGAPRPLRLLVMDSRLCSDPRLAGEVKRPLCLDFLENLHAMRAERMTDLTVAALRRMGPAIAGELKERIAKSAYPEERAAAAQALARIAEDGGAVDDTIRFFRGLEPGDVLPRGTAVREVGRLCASPRAGERVVGETCRDYLKRMSGGPDWPHVVAALGWIGASPACARTAATDIALRLLDLLESDLPSPEVRETKTAEGTHLAVGAEAAVYTDLLPDVIGGIGRIACTDKLAPGLLERVIGRLVSKFAALVEYREIWAPGSVVELARALGDMARRRETPPGARVRIVETLSANLGNLSTVRIVSEILASDERSKRWGELAAGCAERLFAMARRADYRDIDDRRTIAASLGRLALNRGLDPEARGRAVETLAGERAPDFAEGRAVLERLAACRSLPADVRRRVAAILKGMGRSGR